MTNRLTADLENVTSDRVIAMYTVFFDDSGTDRNSDIAIAACYVSTNNGWDSFVSDWDNARWEEGFDTFHMAEFVAPREQGHKPFCAWTDEKKIHVYNRLAEIINRNKRIGIAAAVPKKAWDSTPDYIRGFYGREHYTFAVRQCLLRLAEWKRRSLISLPIRYVFDWQMRHDAKRIEIERLLDFVAQNQDVAELYGLEPSGFSFERKHIFKPLQAADILAWQMRSHMRKIWPLGEDAADLCHSGFRILREDQEVDLGFFTESHITDFVSRANTVVQQLGLPSTIYPQLALSRRPHSCTQPNKLGE